jgi:hypothetical protein
MAARHILERTQQPFASCTERSISRSDSITSKVANPAAIAGSFFEKADPCTTARTMELNTLSKIRLWVSTAPTGTWPPDNALASSRMSGSMPQCSLAMNRPVRPSPVWISSATNSVPYLCGRAQALLAGTRRPAGRE